VSLSRGGRHAAATSSGKDKVRGEAEATLVTPEVNGRARHVWQDNARRGENMPLGNPNPNHRQLALFAPEDLAPADPPPDAGSRRKRLARPLQALLHAIDKPTRKPRVQDPPASDRPATADWLESFFDDGRGA